MTPRLFRSAFWRWAYLAIVLLGAVACLDSGAQVASAELRVSGDTPVAIEGRGGWQVTLQVARVAFGPLWLCPGTTAGELCDVARAEWLDAVVVDALDSQTKRAGELLGSEGKVRSWMYDYGLVSRLTEQEPYQTEAARALGGNSVRIEGCATKEAQSLCFGVGLPVSQGAAAEQGVPVVRVSGDGESLGRFGSARRLTAVFDAGDWLQTVDFDALFAEHACETDCGVISIAQESQADRAIRSALEGTARPQLVWKGATK